MRKIEFCCICSKPLFRSPVRHLADGRAIGPDCLQALADSKEVPEGQVEPTEADEDEEGEGE